jgi:hypothetical protein
MLFENTLVEPFNLWGLILTKRFWHRERGAPPMYLLG